MRTERRPLFGFLFRLLWRISVVWAVVSGFAHLPVIYRYAEAALPWLRLLESRNLNIVLLAVIPECSMYRLLC